VLIDEIHKLFLEIADLDPVARAEYLDRHNVQAEMRVELESLLHFDRGGADVLTGVVGSTMEQFLDSAPEKFCGPYELLRPLGRGGMGSVYLAQRRDGEVDLRVAIKFLRGQVSPSFSDRFLQERQILASLHHPGIARLLDAGHTSSGNPYLVMEYVDGSAIDVYCGPLNVEAKLKVFLGVCEAISYLHRHLVIHRDLKPSNILVESDGAPKILDFGIAKILDEPDPQVTRERVLTPQYASPEQVRGMAKTTATDVYSLGAVLYELLTSRSPHAALSDTRSIEEIICTVDPEPMRCLNPSIPADLEFIVRRALRKEPADRYATVDAFADDVRALLDSRPVKARSGDAWYRLHKFVRRHWLPVAAAAAAILSLSIGIYAAHRQTVIAQRRFSQLRQLSTRMLGFDSIMQGIPGTTAAREKIVSISTDYLDGLASEARGDAELTMDVANGYLQTAEIQGVPTSPSLGHFKDAEANLAKAAALVESMLASARPRAETLRIAAEIEHDRTVIADTVHDRPTELVHANRAADYVSRMLNARGLSNEEKLDASRIYLNLGQSHMNMHRYPDAIAMITRGIELGRSAGIPTSGIAQGLSGLANARRQSGDLEGALTAIDEASALAQTSKFPNPTLRANGLYAIEYRRGLILGEDGSVSLGRPQEAEQALQKAFDIAIQMSANDPNDFSFRDRAGTSGLHLADIVRHRDPARAVTIYDVTLQRLREIKNNSSARRQEARVLAHSSYPLRDLHRGAEARERVEAALQILRQIGTSAEFVGSIEGEWDQALRASADDAAAAGNPAQARTILLDLEAKLIAQHPDLEGDLRHADDMSRLYDSIAQVDGRLGNREEQAKYQSLRGDLWRRWDGKLPNNSFILKQLQNSLLTSSIHSAK
jgi:tetratricopeptide (TPR) repeat protein